MIAPGVPEAELARLTERLYRVESSRSRAGGGSGLGLAIAQAIVSAHGGATVAEPSPLGGLCWRVRFPLLEPREVVARLKAVLRRTHGGAHPADQELVLDDAGWRAMPAGRDLGLTAVEYQLLKVLAAQPGRIFSREQLMDAMYRDTRVVSDRTVDSHVKKLRKKVADVSPHREIIHSVYGVGDKFEWSVAT